MMAPVSAKLFIARRALPVLPLLHGYVLPMQGFQRLATTLPQPNISVVPTEPSTCLQLLRVTMQGQVCISSQ